MDITFTKNETAILQAITDRIKEGQDYVVVTEILLDTGLSASGIRSILKELQARGFVEVEIVQEVKDFGGAPHKHPVWHVILR